MRVSKTTLFVILASCITGAHLRTTETRRDFVAVEQIKTKGTDNAKLLYDHIKTETIGFNSESELLINIYTLNISISRKIISFICGSELRRFNEQKRMTGRIGLSKDGKLLPVIHAPMLHVSSTYCRQGIEYEDDYLVTMLDLSYASHKKIPQFSPKLYNSLRYLDLSNNEIHSFNTSVFRLFKQLEYLDLKSNRLQELVIDPHSLRTHFMTTHGMVYLDVSHQNFTMNCPSVPQIIHDYDTLFYIESSGNHRMSELTPNCLLSTNYFKNMIIHVDGERLDCNCSIDFDWESGTPDSKNCGCHKHILDKSRKTETEIFTYEYVVLLCTVSFISGFSIFGLLISVWCFLKRRKQCYSYCMKNLPSGDDLREQDNGRTGIYIVSAEEDNDVLKHFMFELEKRGIQTISEQRDLAHEAGKNIIWLIHRCIDNTKRSLFLISANFLEDKECMYSFYQAKGLELSQNRFVIIIIQLEEQITPMNMSDTYVQNIVFNYPVPPNKEDAFWAKLVKCIEDENVHVHIAHDV